jgi:rRNA-processing protein FCF1
MGSDISYVYQLKSRLRKFQERFVGILQSSQFERYVQKPNPYTILGSNPPKSPEIKFRWVKLPIELEREQNKILKDFDQWHTDFIGLFSNATKDEDSRLKMLYLEMDSWLKYRKSKKMPDSAAAAVALFGKACEEFIGFLDELTPSGTPNNILVVDTSAIIDCPDISLMSKSLNINGVTFIFPATVISELDGLKTSKRDESFRRRLTTAINNLNELMTKGDVLEGVKLANNMVVKMLAAEPNFSQLPKWLDSTINDDRILGSAIELQRSNPNSNITILANDINMQNKARLAGIPVMRMPDSFEDAI